MALMANGLVVARRERPRQAPGSLRRLSGRFRALANVDRNPRFGSCHDFVESRRACPLDLALLFGLAIGKRRVGRLSLSMRIGGIIRNGVVHQRHLALRARRNPGRKFLGRRALNLKSSDESPQ